MKIGYLKSNTLFLLVFILIVSCNKSDDEPSDLQPEQPIWYSSVESLIKQSKAKAGAPAAIVGVFNYDTLPVVYAIGHSNIESLSKAKDDMHFRIASNSKTFTAQTVLLLVEEGKIDLDGRLNHYLPECGIQHAGTITVRQLLNMTSGIANYNGQSQFVDVWNTDPLLPWAKDTILSIIKSATPDFLPGQGWNYSDSNYFLLGLIIESVTGNTAEDEITKRTIIPLGLAMTSFPLTPEMPENYCSGYKLNEVGILVESTSISPSGPWTGGAMISNIYDMGTWVKALGTGELLSQSMKNECFDFVDFSETASYGLGVMQLLGLRGHTGMIQGFESVMLYSPEKDAAVVVVLNKCNEEQHSQPAVALGVDVFKLVHPELF